MICEVTIQYRIVHRSKNSLKVQGPGLRQMAREESRTEASTSLENPQTGAVLFQTGTIICMRPFARALSCEASCEASHKTGREASQETAARVIPAG